MNLQSLKKKMIMNLGLLILLIPVSGQATDLKLISIDVVPWAYYDKQQGQYTGIFPDLVRELEKQTGYDIEITLTPYVRINRELEAGRQDCTMLITEKERAKITHLGELVFDMPFGVIPAKERNLVKYEDLYGLKISVLRSLNISERFTNDRDLQKEFDTGYKMGLNKIKHGRLDAIAGAIPTIQHLAKEEGISALLGKPLLLSAVPIYLQCSKKSTKTDLIKNINSAMKRIRESESLDKIVSKHWDAELEL